jgi:hypothetical protein
VGTGVRVGTSQEED